MPKIVTLIFLLFFSFPVFADWKEISKTDLINWIRKNKNNLENLIRSDVFETFYPEVSGIFEGIVCSYSLKEKETVLLEGNKTQKHYVLNERELDFNGFKEKNSAECNNLKPEIKKFIYIKEPLINFSDFGNDLTEEDFIFQDEKGRIMINYSGAVLDFSNPYPYVFIENQSSGTTNFKTKKLESLSRERLEDLYQELRDYEIFINFPTRNGLDLLKPTNVRFGEILDK